MKRLSLGIIGVGHLGEIHTRLAKQIDLVQLIGIYDTNLKRAEEISKKYEVSLFRSLEELLDKVEAVSIVVPTESHFEVAKLALEKNKHVFIEKPITSSSEQAEQLIKIAKEKRLKIQVGHIERFNPAFLALKAFELEPLFIEGHRLSKFNPRGTDVSVIFDLMIHDIDLVLQLVPYPIKSIDACGVKVVSESEDIANARIVFENGSVANLTASRISLKDMRKLRLFQRHSYISIDFLNKKTELFILKDGNNVPEGGIPFQIGPEDNRKEIVYFSPAGGDINPLKEELFLFAKAVLEDRKVPVDAEQGLKNLKVAEQIVEQLRHP
ncbi:MAG: Gfo/Idh/MocA family oxidoreductase [Desulfonauticus sp.]|nr:Gfo/Idh/MocA family oxidoreductase [Desulfonauticus sp.]